MRCALLVFVTGHICILSPRQRGPLNVSIPGAPECYRRTAYCGGIPAAEPLTAYAAGGPASILFQQNLNHWNGHRPGFFDVALSYEADPQDSDWISLARQEDFPGFDMLVQTNFSLPVTMPPKPCDHCILRLRYVSYNNMEIDPATNTDGIFYNCADIKLVGSGAPVVSSAVEHVATAPVVAPTRADGEYECAAPATFSMNCTESTQLGVVQHAIWWDAPAQRTRWDRRGAMWTKDGHDHFSLVNDYSKPREFVNWVSRGHCEVHGSDAFYPWAYGPMTGMTYEGNGGSTLDSWSRQGGYSWVTTKVDEFICSPVGWRRGDGYAAICGPVSTDPIPAAVFQPAPSCTNSPVFGGCHPARTAQQWADEAMVHV